MAITDAAAIKFSNEQFRPAADRLARCYYRSKELNDAWTALQGTNDERFALLQSQIERVATLLSNTWYFVFKADRIWQSHSLVSLFPNDPLEVIFDGPGAAGPDPNRPEINGQDVRRLKNRMEEFGNWLSRGTDLNKQFANDATATEAITYTYFDDVHRMIGEGAKVPTTNWGRIIAVERAGDLITEYDVTNTGFMAQILRVAVVPQAPIA